MKKKTASPLPKAPAKAPAKKTAAPRTDWSQPVDERSDFFKPEFGQAYRVHLLRPPFGRRVHKFIAGVGFVISDSEYDADLRKLVGDRGEVDNYLAEDPTPRYVAPIVVYATDKNGQVSGPASKAEFTIQVWTLSSSQYQKLFNLYTEYGPDLMEQDLKLTVTKKGTMVFIDSISVAAKGALSNDATLAKRIEDEFDADKFDNEESLIKLLGRTLTLEELEEAMESAKA